MLVETVVLLALQRCHGQRRDGPRLAALHGSWHVCLMLALRAVLAGGGWMTVASFLMLAFVFHILDIVLRWKRG
jgi:hypothetical protein